MKKKIAQSFRREKRIKEKKERERERKKEK